MNRLLTATAVALALASPPTRAAALPVTVDASACDAPLRVEADHESLRLLGRPGHRYRLWIEEHGVDIELRDPVDPARMRDSAPARHAMEPLVIEADASARAVRAIQVVSQEPGAWLTVSCDARASDPTLDLFTRLRTQFRSTADPLDALKAVAAAGIVLWNAPAVRQEWVYFQLASVARSGALLHEAAAWALLAEGSARRNGSQSRVALARFLRGQSLFGVGDRGAEQAFRGAAQAAAEAGMLHARAIAEHDLCLVQRVRGDVADAAECLARSAATFDTLGERRDRSNALRNRATALLMLGRYEDARRALSQAAAHSGDLGNSRQQALVAQMQAQLATWAGDFESALSLLGTARSQLAGDNYVVEAIHTQRLIADTYALAGEPKRALQHYRQALDAYEDRRMLSRSAPIKATMARWLEEQGRLDEALVLLETARGELEEAGSTSSVASALLGLARLHLASGNPTAARQALDAAERRHPLSGRWRGEAVLIESRLAGPERASADALEASMRAAVGGGHFLLYLELADAAVKHKQATGDRAAAEQLAQSALQRGYQAVRRVRSPGLRHALLRRLVPFAVMPVMSLPEGHSDADQVWSALAEMEHLRALEQRHLAGSVPDDLLDELERTLASEAMASEGAATSKEREALLLALARVDADAPEADDVERAARPRARALPARHALLYLLTDGRSAHALRLDERGWYVARGLDAHAIRSAASRLRTLLADGHAESAATREALSSLIAAMRWPELMDRTPGRLYVVADRALAGLPWALMPTEADGSAPLGLVSELVMLQALGSRATAPPGTVHALGAGAGAQRGLASLPSAEDELTRVATHWTHLSVVSSPRADRAALTRALGTPRALVHIAAHGRADQGLAEESGLWLRNAAGEPQFVSALRLRQLPVSASMIVLSACESGYTEADRSFGVGGVGGSLVDAGAGAVIATRWPVSDRAALTFSDTFHRELANQPGQAAAALRQAIAAVQRVPALRHPTHWAGWFLLRAGPDWAPLADSDRTPEAALDR